MKWRQDGPFGFSSGDVGGDWQAGDSVSVRFRLDEEPRPVTADVATDPRSGPLLKTGEKLHSLVTVSIYPIRHDDNDGCGGKCTPGALELQEQIEYMVCTDPGDPGGTERHCGYEYAILSDLDGTDLDLPDVEAAMVQARRLLGAQTAEQVTWDGRAPWETL